LQIFNPSAPLDESRPVGTILFITATRIGDAVISTGLLDYLRHRWPEARFTVACGPLAAGIFERMPGLDGLILMPKRKRDGHWFALWAQVVRRRWDLVIDLRGSTTAWFMLARQRIVLLGGRRLGGRRPGLRLQHLADRLGLHPPPLPVAWTSEADRTRASVLLPGGLPLVGLGPTANWAGKVWPPERFVALFRELQVRSVAGARPVIFAGPGETEATLSRPVAAALPEAIDLSGRLTLPEAAACLSRLTLFVGNDSGLMHLAAATGVPTLGLFGPSPVEEYAPSGRRARFVVAPGPVGQAPMTALTVEAARNAALALLQDESNLPA
jgi:heptosyltransferase III